MSEYIHSNLNALERSATLAINEHSDNLEKQGKHIFRFGFGQSPFPVPEKVVDSLQANAFRKNYLSVEGLPELRQAIANYHQKFDNIDIESEQVLIGPGSKELMFSLQLALKGITILPAPCWVSYSPQAKILNREIIFIQTRYEDNWQLLPYQLTKVINNSRSQPKLLILNYPGNPHGCTFETELLKELANVCRKNKIIVLGDGVKAEYEMPTNSNTKTLRHINSSIKTVDEAKIKAIKLLELHSQEFKKIHLKLQKEGLELLEAGDIITLDFPNHNIPKDDYQVFEVSNVLSGTTEIVVGTFNKNIAERLTELDLESKNSNFTLFTKNSMSANVGKFITDDLDIDQNNIKYVITTVTTTGGIISGFGNTLGFGSTLGFGTATTSTLKEYESDKSEGI